MLKLTHARAAKETGYHGPTEPLPGLFDVHRSSFVIEQGYTYRFPAGRFHRSPVLPGVTVTCVEKHNQSTASARILYPVTLPPVMAFGHENGLEGDWPGFAACERSLRRSAPRGATWTTEVNGKGR